MKIMLVHNRAEYYQNLNQVLKQNRHEVLTEDSVDRSIAAILSDPGIDLVVSDFNVPEQGGLYLLDYLKSLPRLEKLPVIITGISLQKETVEVCLRLGAQDVIHLPVREEVLLGSVNKAISARKRTVLLVTAESAVMDSVGQTVELEGFRVLIAGSATEALKILGSEKVDVVVSDMTLPGMPGLEFLISAKATQGQVPVVLITGSESGIKLEQAIAAGADALVDNPILKTRMIFAIEQALSDNSTELK
jgi:CheY-like chemotaxis protein